MASREVMFGIPGYMKWIPAPLSGMETAMSGNRTATPLLNGRKFIGGSLAASKSHSVSWLGTIDELQDIIDYGNGVYGEGPFYYSDPMAFDNALSPVYAAPHLLTDIEHYLVTGVRVTRIPSTADAAYKLPPFSALVERSVLPDMTKPSPMTVAIPEGYKAVVRVYASAADAIKVGLGTGASFVQAAVQPSLISAGYWQADYSGVDFVALHFGVLASRVVHGLVVELRPIRESALPSIWRSGQGHTAVQFGEDGLNRTAYMAKSANGVGLIGLSGTLVEV